MDAGNAKSSARLLCPTNEMETHEWATEYVRRSTVILASNSQSQALGAPLGGQEALDAEAGKAISKANETRRGIAAIEFCVATALMCPN